MPSFTRCFVLLAFALSASTLTTPHVIRNALHHRGHAAHISTIGSTDPDASENTLSKRRVRNRRRNGRCNPPASSSAAASSTQPTTPAPHVANHPSPPNHDTTTTKTSSAKSTTPTPSHTASGGDGGNSPSSSSGSSGSSGDDGSSNADEPSFMRGTQTGQGTYYGTGLGACGFTNKDTDMIVAVSHLLYDAYPGYRLGNPNNNPVCGRNITATYQGKSVTVEVTDRCEGCELTDLDFSPGAFDKIADPAIGRLDGVTWVWLNGPA